MKTDNLIPAAPLDRRGLAPGVQLCFTRLDAPLCPPPLDWPRLLVFDFCRSGRRAIPDGAQYAIVTEGHAAVSFAVPGADFYLPGSQYEALQLFIDPDAVQADSFLTLMGLEIGGIADYFCRGGVHCCPMSDAITAIVDEVWDDAAYAAPGELAGLSVIVSGEDMTLSCDGLQLPAGASLDICPANCLPYLLRALAEGYVLEQGGETLADTPCLRLTLDTTAPGGNKVLCAVWLDAEGLFPRYAEFSQNEQVVLTAKLLDFTCTTSEG